MGNVVEDDILRKMASTDTAKDVSELMKCAGLTDMGGNLSLECREGDCRQKYLRGSALAESRRRACGVFWGNLNGCSPEELGTCDICGLAIKVEAHYMITLRGPLGIYKICQDGHVKERIASNIDPTQFKV